MEPSEVRKLAEAVEAGLRDGRSLDSLRKAMQESGYDQGEIREVISSVDRKRTIRRPQRKRELNLTWVAAAAVIVIVIAVGAFMFMAGPVDGPDMPTSEEPVEEVVKICYALNESIMETMKEAGADCDRWFLIKEV